MVRVAVHVGAHKTGTSLIQKYMRDKPEQIDAHGIRTIGRTDTNSLIGWGGEILESPRKLTERIEKEATQPDARYVIISHENTLGRPLKAKSEHLYPDAEPRIEALARILRPWDSRVLFYIRRQSGFLESYYLQLVQQGSTMQQFANWLDEVDLGAVSWRPAVEMLRTAFGPERVRVVGFEEISQGQEMFLKRFFLRIDDRLTLDPSYDARRNFSISEKGLRVALAAAPHLRTPDERKAMRVFLQKNFSNAKYPRPVLFSDAQKEAVALRYDAEYADLLDPL